jgi:heme exporter protein A
LTLLAARGLAVARGGRVLAEGITLELARGAAVLVTGANGAGKSSLLRVFAGLLAPAAGTVARDARIAWMGEAAALDADRPIAAALAFWAAQDGVPAAATRVAAALAAVALDDLADVPVRLLSTGQRRRAALARVVASGAPVWLLDEPASGLDAAAVARLELLLEGHRGGGGAVVVATHQPLALAGASEVAL